MVRDMNVKASNQITIMKVVPNAASDDITVGCRNLIRNSENLIYQNYYFTQENVNLLESHSIENPQNEVDTCAKFTIDDTTMPFTFNNITTINEQYTLSFWLKTEESGSIQVYDKVFGSATEWQKYSIVFTANDTNLNIYFTNVGTYYIYHSKLEIGNKATDWTPAPEDLKSTVTELTTRVVDAETAIETNANEISLKASKSEVNENLELYRKNSSSELEVTADAIRLELSEQVTDLNNADDDLMALYKEMRMNYDFTSEGQFIGKQGSNTIMKLVNDMLQILISGNPVTTLDTHGLSADMANIEVLRIGDYSLTKSNDGHLRII